MEKSKYKDGQVYSVVPKDIDGNKPIEIGLRCNSYEDLFRAASIKEAIDFSYSGVMTVLNITCLIGQRADRRFDMWGSFDLKIIANFINSMNYDIVRILHPHSDVATALINNCSAVSHESLVKDALEKYEDCNTLVSPDAGAYKSTRVIADNLGVDVVAANKVRVDGEPKITFVGDVEGKNVLIVDDIADGGRTFVALAKELREQGAKEVRLYVTHGMFHYGFEELKEEIDHIYCTNSYRDIDEEDYVTQFKVIESDGED